MALLTAGYWQTTYWVDGYFHATYWPNYGLVVIPDEIVYKQVIVMRSLKDNVSIIRKIIDKTETT